MIKFFENSTIGEETKQRLSYEPPQFSVTHLAFEQSIAASSATPGVAGDYNVQESWEEVTVTEDIDYW